ncbi:Putative Nudix hydrolase YfcD [Salmonella enterica subsp. enterica]|uniref:Nudix hydrolase YfcD n=1 Tax=Salmonella enterica I TaxID=59201 RepID=A0A3S4JCU5_SALET|nr:Putative Nudix hydrolase YfcD [Salmonella enterica subsp. enterica]
MSSYWNLPAAKRKKSWVLQACRLPNTVCFTLKTNIAGFWGALFSCVSHGPFALQEDEVSEVCWLDSGGDHRAL